jgi:hypothetical protein
VFDNRVLKEILGPEQENVTGRCRKMHDIELNYFQAAPNQGG